MYGVQKELWVCVGARRPWMDKVGLRKRDSFDASGGGGGATVFAGEVHEIHGTRLNLCQKTSLHTEATMLHVSSFKMCMPA